MGVEVWPLPCWKVLQNITLTKQQGNVSVAFAITTNAPVWLVEVAAYNWCHFESLVMLHMSAQPNCELPLWKCNHLQKSMIATFLIGLNIYQQNFHLSQFSFSSTDPHPIQFQFQKAIYRGAKRCTVSVEAGISWGYCDTSPAGSKTQLAMGQRTLKMFRPNCGVNKWLTGRHGNTMQASRDEWRVNVHCHITRL